jgi:type VI secretion system secreted protein Hcp
MTEIFLWVDQIPGESLDAVGGGAPHIDDIELLDWKFGMGYDPGHPMKWTPDKDKHKDQSKGQSKGQSTGQNKDNTPEHPSVQSLKVWKLIDLATKPLVQACALGTPIEKATLTVRKSAGDYKLEYLVVDFADLKVMSVKWELSVEGQKKEEVTFKFTKFKLTYTMQDNAGEPKGSLDYGWDEKAHAEWHGDNRHAQ